MEYSEPRITETQKKKRAMAKRNPWKRASQAIEKPKISSEPRYRETH